MSIFFGVCFDYTAFRQFTRLWLIDLGRGLQILLGRFDSY